MIRIGKPKSGLKLPLGAGAWLAYRQATSVDREAALHSAREFFKAVHAGAAALSDFDLDIGDAKTLQGDDGLSSGVSLLVFNAELVMRCCSGWEGVADETGEALPFTRANVANLLRDSAIFELISSVLSARLVTLDAEGNASAPLPNGVTAGAQDTAAPAAS